MRTPRIADVRFAPELWLWIWPKRLERQILGKINYKPGPGFRADFRPLGVLRRVLGSPGHDPASKAKLYGKRGP